MGGGKILEFENGFEKRKLIYDYILEYPGLHTREISRKLNIPRSTLLYHLNYLKKSGFIVERNEGSYLRYFDSKKIETIDKEIFALLRKRVVRNILLVLAYYRVCTQAEIVKHLENDCNIKKHPTTIAFHLDRLIEMGVVEYFSNGRQKMYFGNYKLASILIDFILEHKISFLGDSIRWHLHRLNKHSPEHFEKVEQIFSDVFPHPYHV